MPAITSIDEIPTSYTVFPSSTHPDVRLSGDVHHGWNTGRQLLLHAANSGLAKSMSGQDYPHRQQAIAQLRALAPILDELAGPLTIALYLSAVQQPPPEADTAFLTPLLGEALADLGAWGIRTPLPEQLGLITQAVQAMQPCMPD